MRNSDTQKKYFENYFGGCPECGGTNGYLNIGPDHSFICHDHKTKWWAGNNLMADWEEENGEIWKANRETLKDFREVKPVEVVNDSDFEPLANRGSFDTHDEWFIEILRKQANPLEPDRN